MLTNDMDCVSIQLLSIIIPVEDECIAEADETKLGMEQKTLQGLLQLHLHLVNWGNLGDA